MIKAKQLFDFYLNASLHVGLAVWTLVRLSEILLNIDPQPELSRFVFPATVAGYNILRYFDAFCNNRLWFQKNQTITAVTVVALIAASYFFLFLPLRQQLALLSIGPLVVIYPFLRRFGLAKMFLVSFCMTAVTVYVPASSVIVGSNDFYLTAVQRFFVVISWLIPFEIYDSPTDHPSLRTLPQQFGIRSAKIFGMLLVLPFLILEFFKTEPSYLVLIVAIITVLLIHFSKVDRHHYYTAFWVESIPVIWWLLTLLSGNAETSG